MSANSSASCRQSRTDCEVLSRISLRAAAEVAFTVEADQVVETGAVHLPLPKNSSRHFLSFPRAELICDRTVPPQLEPEKSVPPLS